MPITVTPIPGLPVHTNASLTARNGAPTFTGTLPDGYDTYRDAVTTAGLQLISDYGDWPQWAFHAAPTPDGGAIVAEYCEGDITVAEFTSPDAAIAWADSR